MNRFLLNIIFLLIAHSLIGQQNLVPNGSFEEYSECPTGNELNNGQFERATGWFRPTNSTPDFIHRCNSGNVSIPTNFWGHQESFHGDGYVSVGMAEWNDAGQYVGFEYMRTTLKVPLKPCVKYHFSMYVSLVNKSTHGVKRIGALFTEENDFTPTEFALNRDPQYIYDGTPIIDTSNWTKIEGEFVADGFEQYLTIGYFRNTVEMDTLFLHDTGINSFATYYIDSISLFEVGAVSEELCHTGNLSFPNIITPNGDNSNDVLDASKYFAITDEIVILNRWGNIITILTEEQPIWDGRTSNDTPCKEGVYFYKFSYQWGDELKNKSGFIHLVR